MLSELNYLDFSKSGITKKCAFRFIFTPLKKVNVVIPENTLKHIQKSKYKSA